MVPPSLAMKPRLAPDRVITWLLLLAGGIAMLTPLLFMFSTSLKGSADVYDLRLIPAAPTFDNYVKVLSNGRFLRWAANSIGIATVVTVSNVFFDSLVGYTLAKYRFRGRYLVFLAILSTLMIPTEMLYFGVADRGFDGGAAVTASHNPPQYNGMKLVGEGALPLSGDAGIPELKRRVLDMAEAPPAAKP